MTNTRFHIPAKDKWEFDETVTDIFDDMLRRSIPQYDVMRDSVTSIVTKYLPETGALLDLGCSRGETIASVIKHRTESSFVGIDISEPMLDVCRARFGDSASILNIDLRRDFPQGKFDVVTAILSLQFIPIEYRQKVIQSSYAALETGGAMIVVEKILGSTAKINDVLVQSYYKLKEDNGYSHYEIERKRLSLEGVLVPVTADWNREMLRSAGFSQVECFWRWMNFAAWVAVK